MPTEPDFHSSVDTPYMDKVVSGAIIYTENTKLSDEEKRIARQNIDAAAEGQDFTILGVYNDISELPETALTGDAYEVRISDPEDPPIYMIYIYDGVNHEWENYGQLSPGLQVIDSASNDLTHTLSSAKTNSVFEDFMATSSNITNNAATADKIQEGAVSGFYTVTISSTQSEWVGEEVTQYLSPDGVSSDYTISDNPSSLNKVEFLPASLILEPDVDYTYIPGTSTGTIHFRVLPAVGSQTYAVTYNSTHPPFHRTVSIPGILSTDKPIVNLRPSNIDYATAKNQIEAWKEIYSIVPIDDGLIVRAYWYISTSIPIAVRCIRK